MNEEQLEKQCLAWFEQENWEVLYGPDIVAPKSSGSPIASQDFLRQDYKKVLLEPYLEASFSRINSHLPSSVMEQCFEQVLQALYHPESLDLLINNRAFHAMLINGVPISYKKSDGATDIIIDDHAFLIDFENLDRNRFTVVNQFTIQGSKQLRRPDIVVFINGIPLAVIELKSPADENVDIWDAFNQLQTYKNEMSDLFLYNEALIISDGYNSRIGSLTANQERFAPWRTIADEFDKPVLEWQIEAVIKGFFNRKLFLDYLRFFILFEDDSDHIIKKIAAYHQFHAVREAVDATIMASQLKGDKKAGVIWHTQGSGKSISMVCYAGKLLQRPEMNNPTIVVVTDRNDLDGQLFATFSQAKSLLKQIPMQANDREELRNLLSERESGGIIFTTVQKFSLMDEEEVFPLLNGRHNIVVISDEAHRSQYGLKAVLTKDGYKYGYAKHMRDGLKNASFIGFTGTPVSLADKDTQAVFGEYISIYDIQDAVNDGATVPIYYESRLAKLDLNYAEIEELSAQVDEIIEDEENLSSREKAKGEWSRLEKLVGASPRLVQVAEDLINHFEIRNKSMDGKAMIVGMSREICVQLYDEIIKIKPEWHDDDPEKGVIKIIMTGSASDKAHFQPHIYNKQTKKRLAKRFKDENDGLKLVIVRDMWLTGFDAPCCHTMYVDKPMKGHGLMQSIARVNRVFRDKPAGLVVDYIGIANELKLALKTYTDSKGKGKPTNTAEEGLSIFLEKMESIRHLFAKTPQTAGLDISAFVKASHVLQIEAANYILGIDDGKKRLLDLVLMANKAYSLCSNLDEAKALNLELAFYNAIKTALLKTSVSSKRTEEAKNSALKQILDNSVVAEGVVDIFKACGLDKPNIGLLSPEFLEDVRQMPYRNLAVELLQKLMDDSIKSHGRTNLVQEKKYADRLKETIRKYHNRAIETAQVIEELIDMAKAFMDEITKKQGLGLNFDEVAFYDALANNESAVRELGDDILKKIAIEITEKLRNSTTVDWQVRESVRARLRILVRRTLQKYKYPPDKSEEAIELILAQAEVLSDEWTRE